jgi:hypothetical protein
MRAYVMTCVRKRPSVKTVADPRVVDGLARRLERLTPATPRRWGTLSAHEMLCHLADASASVLAGPAVFALDRERAIAGLRAMGSAPPNAFSTTHGQLGAMVPRDWLRWGYRHIDHHLRQSGL